MNTDYPFLSDEVKEVFLSYPKVYREKLLILRSLIFETAKKIDGIEKLQETLKWNEPSYLPTKPNIGTTIRIAWSKSMPDLYAIHFNCKTTLIETFQKLYSNTFCYLGNRSLVFKREDQIPKKELSECIQLALTYHLSKKWR